jgi:hypothetical protein
MIRVVVRWKSTARVALPLACGWITKARSSELCDEGSGQKLLAALRFMEKVVKRHGSLETITTGWSSILQGGDDRALNPGKQEVGRWANKPSRECHLVV